MLKPIFPSLQFLKFLEAYIDENEYVVWRTISTNLSKLRTLISHTDYEPLFNKFCQKLFKAIHETLTWKSRPSDTNSDTLLRPLIISQLIESGCKATISEAKTLFDNGPLKIPVDLRQVVYKGVLYKAKTDSLTKIINFYRETTSQEEQERIYYSLGVLDDPEVIGEAIAFAMSSDVRSTDSAHAIGSIAASRNGRDITWQYVKDNVKTFQEKFGEGTYIVPRLVESLTQNFASLEKTKEIETFFKENKFSGIDRTVQQSIETIRLNELWLSRDSSEIKEFLQAF